MAFLHVKINFLTFPPTDMTHVNEEEIEKVKELIEILQMRQTLLSETTQVSDDALCPICYAQQIGKLISCSTNC